MNVAIIGNNLTSLTLSKALVSKKIKVTLFYNSKNNLKKTNRCIGLTSKNLNFFNEKILKINTRLYHPIKEIGILFESDANKEALNFNQKNKNLFNIIKISNLIFILNNILNKNKFFFKKKIKNKNFYNSILKEKKYDLIFNCEKNNSIINNFFNSSHEKDYNSDAYTFNFTHQKLLNNKAIQIFTKYGPLAFLPLSNNETSVVFSIYRKNKNYSEKELINLINLYNKKYAIKKITKIEKGKLKFLSKRKYFINKVLLFGDILHQIHPLAGQGFNMTLRDLEILLRILQKRIDLGLQLDPSVFEEFENKVKHFNFIYSNSINFIQSFFQFDSKYKNNISNKIINLTSKNNFVKNFITKVADQGININ